jgi:hypothetical protein
VTDAVARIASEQQWRIDVEAPTLPAASKSAIFSGRISAQLGRD